MKAVKEYMEKKDRRNMFVLLFFLSVSAIGLILNKSLNLHMFSKLELMISYIALGALFTHFVLVSLSLKVPEKSEIKVALKKPWGLFLKDRKGNNYYVPYNYWHFGLKKYIASIKKP